MKKQSDLQKYIKERKIRDAEFLKDYEKGCKKFISRSESFNPILAVSVVALKKKLKDEQILKSIK